MVVDAILKRRSVRSFLTKDVPHDLILAIVQAGMFAPSARGNKSVEFIIIKEQDKKEKLYEITTKLSPQDFIKEAPVIIIPISDTTKTNLNDFDLAAATQNMMIQASAEGLGTVWKHLRPPLHEEVRALFSIPDHFSLMNAIAIGYPKEPIVPHSIKNLDSSKIHSEHYTCLKT